MQLLCALAGLVLGLLLPRITTDATVASTRVTDALVAVGFGVLELVTVIFSLLFLVVQWAFSSLSPRLNLFRDDPIVWRTFEFCRRGVRVLGYHGPGHRRPESVGDVTAAEVVAVLAALPDPDPANESVRLHSACAHAGGHRRAGPRHHRRPVSPAVHGRPATGRPAAAAAQGGDLATSRRSCSNSTWAGCSPPSAGGAVIVLRAGMGDTLRPGAPVADLHGGDAADAAVLGGLVTGPERTLDQDPLFAFRLLADIGMRRSPRSTTRPPPPRCWTPSTACSSSWPHVIWTWQALTDQRRGCPGRAGPSVLG